ncbi:MAG: DUF29 family protein [Bryobacteraceae bacterium]
MKTSLQALREMGKTELHELENRLDVLLEHLLKIKHVKGNVGAENLRGWKISVENQQIQLIDLIEGNPGLKPKVTDTLIDNVHRSVAARVKEQYPNVPFPQSRRMSMEEIVGNELMEMLRRR